MSLCIVHARLRRRRQQDGNDAQHHSGNSHCVLLRVQSPGGLLDVEASIVQRLGYLAPSILESETEFIMISLCA